MLSYWFVRSRKQRTTTTIMTLLWGHSVQPYCQALSLWSSMAGHLHPWHRINIHKNPQRTITSLSMTKPQQQQEENNNNMDENSHKNNKEYDYCYSLERLGPPFDPELYDFYRANFACSPHSENHKKKRGVIPKLPPLSSSSTQHGSVCSSDIIRIDNHVDDDNKESLPPKVPKKNKNKDMDDSIYILRQTNYGDNYPNKNNSIVAAVRLTRTKRLLERQHHDNKQPQQPQQPQQQQHHEYAYYTFLRALCVSKEYRQKGLALRLMDQSRKDFVVASGIQSHNATTTTTITTTPKPPPDHYYYCYASSTLQSLYEKAGFEKISTAIGATKRTNTIKKEKKKQHDYLSSSSLPTTRTTRRIRGGASPRQMDASDDTRTSSSSSTTSPSRLHVPNWLIQSFLSMKFRVEKKNSTQRRKTLTTEPMFETPQESLELFVRKDNDFAQESFQPQNQQQQNQQQQQQQQQLVPKEVRRQNPSTTSFISSPSFVNNPQSSLSSATHTTTKSSNNNNGSHTSNSHTRKLKVILIQHVNEQQRNHTATGWLLNDEAYYNHHFTTTHDNNANHGLLENEEKRIMNHPNGPKKNNHNDSHYQNEDNDDDDDKSSSGFKTKLSNHIDLEVWAWSGRNDNGKIERHLSQLTFELERDYGCRSNDATSTTSSSPPSIVLLWTESGGRRQAHQSTTTSDTSNNNNCNNKQQQNEKTSTTATTTIIVPTTKAYIILDGTWQEAKQMFRKNPNLWNLPRDSIKDAPPSVYTLRGDYTGWRQRFSSSSTSNHSSSSSSLEQDLWRHNHDKKCSTNSEHDSHFSGGRDDGNNGGLLCTAEVVAALLDTTNDEIGAQEIRQRLETFQHYQTK